PTDLAVRARRARATPAVRAVAVAVAVRARRTAAARALGAVAVAAAIRRRAARDLELGLDQVLERHRGAELDAATALDLGNRDHRRWGKRGLAVGATSDEQRERDGD